LKGPTSKAKEGSKMKRKGWGNMGREKEEKEW